MKKSVCEKLALLILLGGIHSSLYGNTPPSQDGNWPMFMHDLQHSGCSPSSAPDSLYLLWEYDIGQRLFGSPVVHDGTVYQVGRGYLFALDADTGGLLWSSALPVVGSTPFVDGERLYVGTCNGLAALNAETGDVLWHVQLADFGCDPGDDRPTFLSSSPMATSHGIIMFTHRNWTATFSYPSEPDPEGINRVVCVDPETGTLIWEFRLNMRAGYSPVLADERIFVNSDGLRVLDVVTGQQLWSYPIEEELADSSPVISQDIVVTVSTREGIVYAINKSTEKLLWKYDLGGSVLSTPAVYNDRIVVKMHDGTVFVLKKNSGDVVWRKNVQEKIEFPGYEVSRNLVANLDSSPAIADDKLYIGLRSGTFLCFRLETGDVLWSYKTGGSIVASPAVADEKVFVASTDGTLYCFSIDPETYFEKAGEYEKKKNEEKAREFYVRAKEYYQEKKNMEMVEKCDRKLEERTYLPLLAVSVGVFVVIVLMIHIVKKKKTE